LRQHGFPDASEGLWRTSDLQALWRTPDLLLSQCCGYPLVNAFSAVLVPVVTPHYAAVGCSGPAYSSLIFARAADSIRSLTDFHGRRPAVNSPDSMSGMLALKLVFAPYAEEGKFFAPALKTGSHLKSLEAVQSGIADLCAIDPVCVALAVRHRPYLLAGLVEIARSPLVPGLPYVTSASRSQYELARLRNAIAAAFADARLQNVRDALFLGGFSGLARADYQVIEDLERDLQGRGGLDLWQAA
jgi:ABC-type phosphate/phosphonate transport system substrate-binding protein